MVSSHKMNAKLTTQPPSGLSGPYGGLNSNRFMNQIYASHKSQDYYFHKILANHQFSKRIITYNKYYSK